MISQLRIYTIKQGALGEFEVEWREKIRPLRMKLGFKILGAWTIEDMSKFVWMLGYDGPESWDKLDRAFHKSDERRAMRPDPARNITRTEHYFLTPVA